MPAIPQLSLVDPPRGMHLSSVDGQGRLLLPQPVRWYLQALGETAPFVTSLDRQTARIYPRSVWTCEVQPLLAQPGESSAAAKAVSFTANWLGEDCRLDRAGQIRLGQQLREVLQFDSGVVRIYHERGHFVVLPERLYRQRCEVSQEDVDRDLANLERAGLR
jgi:DNA-binding transcriptional regulator/RsmH inhibitor MraZ